jgi:DNA-binding LacI/PurR family transcriptional regulator
VRPEELGEKACRRLLENIEKKGNIKPVKEVLKVNLVKRNSTKNIDS